MNVTIAALLTGPVRALAGTAHASGIDKQPVAQRLWLGPTGFAGDEQADRKHHGGPDKAVHHYAFDHYPYWQAEIGARDVLAHPGAFGENLSTSGVTEADVCVGDMFRLGDALVQVTQARQPCWKLNLRFAHPTMSRLVQQSGKTGWYYRVLENGWVAPGDNLALQERPHPAWPLSRVLEILYRRTLDRDVLAQLARIAEFPDSWRALFARRLQVREVEDWSRRLGE